MVKKLPDVPILCTSTLPLFQVTVRHSLFHLRNDFLDSHQPLIVIIKLQLDSNETRGVKRQTNHRQHCAWV